MSQRASQDLPPPPPALVVRVALPCVCVSGSPFRGLLRRRRSAFLPPGLPTPPPDPTDPSEGTCDLLLRHNENKTGNNSGQDVKRQVNVTVEEWRSHLYPLYAVPIPPLYGVDGGEFSRFCRSGCLGSFVFLGCGLLYVSSLP